MNKKELTESIKGTLKEGFSRCPDISTRKSLYKSLNEWGNIHLTDEAREIFFDALFSIEVSGDIQIEIQIDKIFDRE